MSTSQLEIYNAALTICGERTLHSVTGLSENREPRHLLDNVWNNDGVRSCLESGQWWFAMRAIELDYTTTITPTTGYRRAFIKPTDWVVTSALTEDEYHDVPHLRYVDEAGYWYSDLDVLFIRYVSNDPNYGGDLTKWSAKFADFVSAHFASKIILKLTSDEDKRNGVFGHRKRTLLEAKNVDAMADPVKFLPSGSWTSARGGRSNSDRGSRHRLIG